jgi:hypothetical protein
MAFGDVNVLARQGEGGKALKALEACLDPKARYRDVSLRLGMPVLGRSLAAGGAPEAALVLAKLGKLCATDRDANAMEALQAASHATAKQWADAAQCYLRIVDRRAWPALQYAYFTQAGALLEQAKAPDYAAVVHAYLAKIPAAQDLAPTILLQLGTHQFNAKDPAVLQTRQTLADKYPASAALDAIDTLIRKAQEGP